MLFYNFFFCLETKTQDSETSAKNLNLILKFPKLARIKDLSFDLIFVSRFKEWEFLNGSNLNFLNAPFSLCHLIITFKSVSASQRLAETFINRLFKFNLYLNPNLFIFF